ncbi:hypothetical protein [Microcoleus sp.]|uniref:hypothetical protein n=1 Tax=Microcoleus sp. TaxID=44472 RepID=UPI0035941C17
MPLEGGWEFWVRELLPMGRGCRFLGDISEVIDRDRPESGNISFSGTLFPCEHTNFTITL